MMCLLYSKHQEDLGRFLWLLIVVAANVRRWAVMCGSGLLFLIKDWKDILFLQIAQVVQSDVWS